MIFAGAFLLSFLSLCVLATSPKTGLLLILVFKPIIDASWQHSLFGFNCLRIVGVAVPIIIIFRMILSSDGRISEMPLSLLWIIYIFTCLISFGIILSFGKAVQSFDFLFRVLNGFVGFYMFQCYFKDRLWFRRLLNALLLCGLFPMLMGAYQALTGRVWHLRQTTGGLIRHVGVYHDAFSFRSYGYMTITAILLYWVYFCAGKTYKKFFLALYGLICFLVIFNVYSKAGYVIFGLWLLIWTLMQKKFSWLFVIILGILLFNFATGNRVFKNISTVFLKETSALEGTGETRYILSGRLVVWEDYWEHWRQQDIFNKIFGSGSAAGSAHNDFLRVLLSGGILGLFIYVLLLTVIGWKILKELIYRKTPLIVMAFMIFIMWLVDTLGLAPGLYPAYQWYVWGFIGLALRGVEGLSQPAPLPLQLKNLIEEEMLH